MSIRMGVGGREEGGGELPSKKSGRAGGLLFVHILRREGSGLRRKELGRNKMFKTSRRLLAAQWAAADCDVNFGAKKRATSVR